MKYLFETSDTIVEGVGFSHFSPFHLGWLAVAIAVTLLLCFWYKRSGERARKGIKIAICALVVLDEIVKIIITGYHGDYFPDYLPFHLCSINIFTIIIFTLRPSRLLGNFLYAICTPAAILALVFPTWTKLPFANIMLWHSFTVHIMLLVFPLLSVVSGEVKITLKDMLKSLIILLFMAIPVAIFNLIFDTNFMFLSYAKEGNPLYLFEQLFGNHLIGIPILLPLIIGVMYLPIIAADRFKKRGNK